MAVGIVQQLGSNNHTQLLVASGNTTYPSIRVLNPNDGVLYIAKDRDIASNALPNWDWKIPSQSFAVLPGPFQSVGVYYLDQSGSGAPSEFTVYPSLHTIDEPFFAAIGRAAIALVNSLDITEGVLPPNPPVGTLRLWSPGATELLHILLSSGSDDSILQALAAQVVGNKTFDASSNILSRIARNTLPADASGIAFGTIPNTYDSLMMVSKVRGTASTAGNVDGVRLQVNSLATAIYYNERILATASTVAGVETGVSTVGTIGLMPNALTSGSLYGVVVSLFPGYTDIGHERTILSLFGYFTGGASGGIGVGILATQVDSTQVINRIDIIPGAGNFAAGSYSALYGF